DKINFKMIIIQLLYEIICIKYEFFFINTIILNQIKGLHEWILVFFIIFNDSK
ncbi:MAG: hypothetical protein Edafosvirus32_1, partial [Edafosvirus sp.]